MPVIADEPYFVGLRGIKPYVSSFYVADALHLFCSPPSSLQQGTSRNCEPDGQEQQEQRIAPLKPPHSPSWRHSATVHTEPGTSLQPRSDAPSRCLEGKPPTSPSFHASYGAQMYHPIRFSSGNQHSTTAVPAGRPYSIDAPAFIPSFVLLRSTRLRLSSGSKWLPHCVNFPLCANDESIKRSVPGRNRDQARHRGCQAPRNIEDLVLGIMDGRRWSDPSILLGFGCEVRLEVVNYWK